MTTDNWETITETRPAPADRIDLHQALTDPENQPNQYGVEFGMSGTHMHFKVGNQLFKLAYEPDDQEEFDFMKRMLVNAFTAFTHDVKTAPQPSPTAQSADSVREDAADPLQGAANWLAEAHGQFSPVVLSGCLMIGYNRAKRLHDAALAARKQGGA